MADVTGGEHTGDAGLQQISATAERDRPDAHRLQRRVRLRIPGCAEPPRGLVSHVRPCGRCIRAPGMPAAGQTPRLPSAITTFFGAPLTGGRMGSRSPV